jgi:hypothetical protein
VAGRAPAVETYASVGRSQQNVALGAEDPPLRAPRIARTGRELLICKSVLSPLGTALIPFAEEAIRRTEAVREPT